jgi:two-component system chemotaxis response regulator CheB
MKANKETKVLVVDDAAFMRKAITEILESDSGIQVVDCARNGMECLDKIKKNQPDVVTLDIDMPVMDGLSTIRHIMIESPVPIVILSSLFNDGAITFDALRLGVVDFIPKPSGAISEDIDQSKKQIIDRIKIACSVNLENIRRVRLPKWDPKKRLVDRYGFYPLDYIIALGTTLSGPNTVIRLLTKLPPILPAAVVVVQEISPKIISSFVKQFDEFVPWKVETAQNGQVLEQGVCYISSNENLLSLELDHKGQVCLKLDEGTRQPLNLLFSSAAEIFQQNAIGVLLTGLGDDGADGFARIKEKFGITIAQDTKCCVYPNLTHNAIKNGVADMVLNESEISKTIQRIMR